MVVHVDVHHVFKYPIEFVVQTHFSKYETKRDQFVQRVDTIEHKLEKSTGVDYKRRIATCSNVLPRILQMLLSIKESKFLLEEEAWYNAKKRTLRLASRNLTWSSSASMAEQSLFQPHKEEPSWTELVQHGSIEVTGYGRFDKVLELFAEKFLQIGVKRGLDIMEAILQERWQQK